MRRWGSGWRGPCPLNELNDRFIFFLGKWIDAGAGGRIVDGQSFPERLVLIFFFSHFALDGPSVLLNWLREQPYKKVGLSTCDAYQALGTEEPSRGVLGG